jgi:hypothetical protein
LQQQQQKVHLFGEMGTVHKRANNKIHSVMPGITLYQKVLNQWLEAGKIEAKSESIKPGGINMET